MNYIEKIEALRLSKDISQAEIANEIGISQQVYNNFVNKVTQKVPVKIVEYLTRNIVYDENSTINYEKIASTLNEAFPEYNEIMQVPIVEISAQAGYARGGFADAEYLENLPKTFITKEYEKGNYCVFVIKGDSMDNGTTKGICENDRVLAKELPKMYWNNKLHFKQYIFIIVHNGGCVCKEITEHDVETGDITLHSWNSIYEDRILNLKNVSQLFYVKKIVERPVRF